MNMTVLFLFLFLNWSTFLHAEELTNLMTIALLNEETVWISLVFCPED